MEETEGREESKRRSKRKEMEEEEKIKEKGDTARRVKSGIGEIDEIK